MNIVLGSRTLAVATAKIALIAALAVAFILLHSAHAGSEAHAAGSVSAINSCDTAIGSMNKTLTLIAKRRIAARSAKRKGTRKYKRAKRNLKSALRQGTAVRSAIARHCAGGNGVSALDSQCALSIDSLGKAIELKYTRTLKYKKLKGKSKRALKRKRTMKTQLKKLNERVARQSQEFRKACGNDGSGNGGNGGSGNGGGDGSTPDTTPPGGVIIDGPSGPTNDNTPTVEVTTPETGGHIECKIDDGPWMTVESPWTLPALSDGTHTITCRYVDGAGNIGPETTITVTIDTTAPGGVTIGGPNGPTSDTTPSFNLSGAGSGETYMCSVDGADSEPTGAVYTTPELSEGIHSVSCYLIDEAGNTGPVTTVTVEIDLTAPGSVTITGPGGPTSDTTPEIDVTSGETGGHYECSIDGGEFVTVDPPFNPTLSEGTHTITCRYVDGAGNAGPETTITVVIDTTAPSAPVVSGPTGPTSDNTPSIVISGGGEDVTYECMIDGGTYVAVPAGYTTPQLTDGDHAITCRAIDQAGNASDGTSITVTIDTTAPGALTLTGPSGATNDNTPTYTITGGGSGVTYQCKVDGGSYANVTSPYTTSTLTDGNHTITCRGVDAAGNVGPETSKSVTVDTVAPGSVTVSGPSGLSNDNTPTYTITGGGTGVTYQCKVDGGAYANVTSPYTTTALGEGPHTVSCRAVDAAGNTGAATTVSVTVDTVGPAITIADGAAKWDGTHSFTLSAGGESGVTYKCSIDGGSYVSVSASYTTGVLSNGTHSVSCRGTDTAGNTGTTVTKSFGVFKDPAVVSKSGGFQWGLGCTFSSSLNQLLGCPDTSLVITIPANPNGLTGSYLVDIDAYIHQLNSLFGASTTYTMNVTVDGTKVAGDSATVWLNILGTCSSNLDASKDNLSLSASTEHVIQIRLKTSAAIDLLPSVGSSRLSVSIHH